MKYVLALVVSTAISIAVIPVMMRLAPWLRMVDHPNRRKVHTQPVPRVGGWGIVVGALVPILIWIPMDELVLSYVIGALVLLAFGAWDDRREIGHYTKFLGQFIAVLVVVTYGGLYVSSLPFANLDHLPPAIGIPFTVLAMIGMINAINHSDGLDGLAGGESLLSLAAIVFLAYLANGDIAIMIAAAAIGGVLGFLRYNTYPANVFMGDGGSQYLGFTLGFLALLLTQKVDPTLSHTVVLLLLGLPIADILVVLAKRIFQGMNWFRATKNHIHHRLLELGFLHQESVVIIYSVQTICVVSGILLRHESDWLIMFLYLTVCVGLFASLELAERVKWKAHDGNERDSFERTILFVSSRLLVVAPRRFLDFAIPAYLIVGSMWVEVPRDFGFAAGGVFFLMLLESFLSKTTRSLIRRGLIYVIATFIVYLDSNYPLRHGAWLETVEISFFLLLAVGIALAIRFSPARRKFEFRTTTMDYLMVFVVLTALVFSQSHLIEDPSNVFVVEIIILFYGCELLIIEKRKQWNHLTLSSLVTAAVLTVRGLL